MFPLFRSWFLLFLIAAYQNQHVAAAESYYSRQLARARRHLNSRHSNPPSLQQRQGGALGAFVQFIGMCCGVFQPFYRIFNWGFLSCVDPNAANASAITATAFPATSFPAPS